jgi:hypothetical protein
LQGFRPLPTAPLQTRILPPADNPRKIADFRVVHCRLETLKRALGEESPEAHEALDLVRGLIDRVTIVPDGSAPEGIWLEIEGDLAQLLSFFGSRTSKSPQGCSRGGRATVRDAGTGSHRQLLIACRG